MYGCACSGQAGYKLTDDEEVTGDERHADEQAGLKADGHDSQEREVGMAGWNAMSRLSSAAAQLVTGEAPAMSALLVELVFILLGSDWQYSRMHVCVIMKRLQVCVISYLGIWVTAWRV